MKKVTAYKVGNRIFENADEARREEIENKLNSIVENEAAYNNLTVSQVVELLMSNKDVIKLVSELKALK